jgi:hypothetical protein
MSRLFLALFIGIVLQPTVGAAYGYMPGGISIGTAGGCQPSYPDGLQEISDDMNRLQKEKARLQRQLRTNGNQFRKENMKVAKYSRVITQWLSGSGATAGFGNAVVEHLKTGRWAHADKEICQVSDGAPGSIMGGGELSGPCQNCENKYPGSLPGECPIPWPNFCSKESLPVSRRFVEAVRSGEFGNLCDDQDIVNPTRQSLVGSPISSALNKVGDCGVAMADLARAYEAAKMAQKMQTELNIQIAAIKAEMEYLKGEREVVIEELQMDAEDGYSELGYCVGCANKSIFSNDDDATLGERIADIAVPFVAGAANGFLANRIVRNQRSYAHSLGWEVPGGGYPDWAAMLYGGVVGLGSQSMGCHGGAGGPGGAFGNPWGGVPNGMYGPAISGMYPGMLPGFNQGFNQGFNGGGGYPGYNMGFNPGMMPYPGFQLGTAQVPGFTPGMGYSPGVGYVPGFNLGMRPYPGFNQGGGFTPGMYPYPGFNQGGGFNMGGFTPGMYPYPGFNQGGGFNMGGFTPGMYPYPGGGFNMGVGGGYISGVDWAAQAAEAQNRANAAQAIQTQISVLQIQLQRIVTGVGGLGGNGSNLTPTGQLLPYPGSEVGFTGYLGPTIPGVGRPNPLVPTNPNGTLRSRGTNTPSNNGN